MHGDSFLSANDNDYQCPTSLAPWPKPRQPGGRRTPHGLSCRHGLMSVEAAMPVANIRGVNLNYEVLGTHGPWMALSPGGRRALEVVKPLAQHMANAGYRVLIHDRRNCGVSDIAIGGESSEYEIWADDLYELLSRLNALPAVLGGGLSGCRLSVRFSPIDRDGIRVLHPWLGIGG